MGLPIIHSVLELGPVDFKIDAQTDEERAIAMRHVVHARVLLGQLAVRSSNAPLLSRKVIMHDGTVIEVGRNANQYTGQYNAFARIRVRRGGGKEVKKRREARGRYFWVGWKYREEWQPRTFINELNEEVAEQSQALTMSVWEPEFEDGSHQQLANLPQFEGFTHRFPEDFDWTDYFSIEPAGWFAGGVIGTRAGMHRGLVDIEDGLRIYEPLRDPNLPSAVLNVNPNIIEGAGDWAETVTMDPTQLLHIADDPGDWTEALRPIFTGDDPSLDSQLVSGMVTPGDRRSHLIVPLVEEYGDIARSRLVGQFKKIARGTQWPNYMVKFHVYGTDNVNYSGDPYMSETGCHGPNQSQAHRITVKVVAGKSSGATTFMFDLDIRPVRFGYAWHQILAGSFYGSDADDAAESDVGSNSGVCYGDQTILIDPYGSAWVQRDHWPWGISR